MRVNASYSCFIASAASVLSAAIPVLLFCSGLFPGAPNFPKEAWSAWVGPPSGGRPPSGASESAGSWLGPSEPASESLLTSTLYTFRSPFYTWILARPSDCWFVKAALAKESSDGATWPSVFLLWALGRFWITWSSTFKPLYWTFIATGETLTSPKSLNDMLLTALGLPIPDAVLSP